MDITAYLLAKHRAGSGYLLVAIMKISFALKTYSESVACWQPPALFCYFNFKAVTFQKEWLVVLTGRKLLMLKVVISHLSKPEGSMFTEGKKNNLNFLVKISERSALLCNAALYTEISSRNSHSTRLQRNSCKIILMLTCCLSHTHFFCQTWFTADQIYRRKSGKEGGLLASLLLLSIGHSTRNSTLSFQQITPNFHIIITPPLSICLISCASAKYQCPTRLGNTACSIFSHTKTIRNHVSCPTDVCC